MVMKYFMGANNVYEKCFVSTFPILRPQAKKKPSKKLSEKVKRNFQMNSDDGFKKSR